MLWSELRLIFKTSSLTPDSFYVFNLIFKNSLIIHEPNLCSDSQDTRFLWNVFEAVQKTRSTCFIGFKNTRLRLVFLNPIKHCCSCFKQYLSFSTCSRVIKRSVRGKFLGANILKLIITVVLTGRLSDPNCKYICFHYSVYILRLRQWALLWLGTVLLRCL